ncbi:MAG: hypothetical protein Q8J85_03870 [Sulfuricurvum sp.]|nr:hypothetical protein [Sulfuricurvum sp.]MDP3023495.1 hypothetical protein [Sulfuricurvum sp.]
MQIDNAQYELIINFINENFFPYYNMYDFSKYSLDDYKAFQNNFSSLGSENTSIEEALKWKWGHAGKNNYPSKQQSLVKDIESNWKQFASQKFINPKDTFDYWQNIFNRNTTYITTVYITHLVHYDEIPIIDQHNYRAMNHFIRCFVDSNYQFKKKPSNWDDIIQFKKFINYISSAMDIDKEKLDKFLMMYGKSIKQSR